MVASIAYIERIIETYEKATACAWATPGRLHGVVHLAPELGDEVMVTGDLHGHRQNFNAIRRIAALAQHPRRHLVLQEVCHGGPLYPQGGGCMSHAMLEDVAKLKTQFPAQVHFLLGNHELAELTEYPIQKNKHLLNLLFRLGLQHTYGPATERVRQAYMTFLESCPLAVRLPGGVFISHSIPEDVTGGGFDKTIFSRPLDSAEFHEQSSIFELVWGRDYRPQNAQAFAAMVDARVLINGHEPCSRGYTVPNDTQIILDCCGDEACYVMLSIGAALSQEEIVGRIRKVA
jgi:hypothetical protein